MHKFPVYLYTNSLGHLQQICFYVVCAGIEESFSISAAPEAPERWMLIFLWTLASVGLCGEPGVAHMVC